MIQKVPENTKDELYWKCSFKTNGFNLKSKPDSYFYDLALRKSKSMNNFKTKIKKVYGFKPSGLNINFFGNTKADVTAEFLITDNKADEST